MMRIVNILITIVVLLLTFLVCVGILEWPFWTLLLFPVILLLLFVVSFVIFIRHEVNDNYKY